MRKRRPRRPKSAKPLSPQIRYAIIDIVHGEVLSANHKVIGEAFNSRDEDYTPITNLRVVATLEDVILGEVNRKGVIKSNGVPNLKTIWDGSMNIFFVPPPKP